MFGVGFSEILMIAIVAVIFLGPDKLPGAMVEIAKFIKKAKSAVTDAKESLNSELNLEELKKELGLDDIKNEALAYKQELLEAREKLAQLNPIDQFKEQKEKTKAETAEMESSFHEDANKLSQTNQAKQEHEAQTQTSTSDEIPQEPDQPTQHNTEPINKPRQVTHEPQQTFKQTSKEMPQEAPEPSVAPSPYQTAYDSKTYKALKERNNDNA